MEFIVMRTPLCLLAILSVAACSGGGGSSTTSSSGGTAAANGAVGVNFETFAGIAAAEGAAADTVDFVAARDALDANTADLLNGKPLSEIHNTAFNEIPVRGSATYDGLIGIEAGDDLELAAGIEINATFRTRSLSADEEGLALTINDEAVTGAVEFITTLRPEAPVAATE